MGTPFCFVSGDESLEADARRAAATNSPVLIMGESGTGRSTLAAHIHRLSRRAGSSLVEIDCRTTEPHLLESHFAQAMDAPGGAVLLSGLERGVSVLGVVLKQFLDGAGARTFITPSGAHTSPRLIIEGDQDLRSHIDKSLWQRLVAWPPIFLAPLRVQRRKKWQLLSLFVDQAARVAGLEPPHSANFLVYAHVVSYGWPGNARQMRDYVRHLVDIGALAERRLRLDTEFSFFDESESFAHDDVVEAQKHAADLASVFRNRRQRDFTRALARLQASSSGPGWRELSKSSPGTDGRWSYPDVRWTDPHFASAEMCANVGKAIDRALADLGQWQDRVIARDLLFDPKGLPWIEEAPIRRVISGLSELQLADKVAYAMVTGEIASGPAFLEQVHEAVQRIAPELPASELERLGLAKTPPLPKTRKTTRKKS